MTNANFKDDPAPRFDRELVHAHIRLLHGLAGRARADLGIDGQLVLACYGENPDTGVKTASQVMKFGIGHGLEEMVGVIMALEHHPHLNVYVPFHIVRFGLGARERGGTPRYRGGACSCRGSRCRQRKSWRAAASASLRDGVVARQ